MKKKFNYTFCILIFVSPAFLFASNKNIKEEQFSPIMSKKAFNEVSGSLKKFIQISGVSLCQDSSIEWQHFCESIANNIKDQGCGENVNYVTHPDTFISFLEKNDLDAFHTLEYSKKISEENAELISSVYNRVARTKTKGAPFAAALLADYYSEIASNLLSSKDNKLLTSKYASLSEFWYQYADKIGLNYNSHQNFSGNYMSIILLLEDNKLVDVYKNMTLSATQEQKLWHFIKKLIIGNYYLKNKDHFLEFALILFENIKLKKEYDTFEDILYWCHDDPNPGKEILLNALTLTFAYTEFHHIWFQDHIRMNDFIKFRIKMDKDKTFLGKEFIKSHNFTSEKLINRERKTTNKIWLLMQKNYNRLQCNPVFNREIKSVSCCSMRLCYKILLTEKWRCLLLTNTKGKEEEDAVLERRLLKIDNVELCPILLNIIKK